VLISKNKGATWTPYGGLTDPRTDLIEGAVVSINDNKVLQLFRTNTGCAFQSVSLDSGRTWQAAEPIAMPNPNSKMHVVSHCSLNHADRSLNHADCSLNHADRSLNHAHCSLNQADRSLNQVCVEPRPDFAAHVFLRLNIR
jgi:predicted neuraminidase